jgi:hypothetical protein
MATERHYRGHCDVCRALHRAASRIIGWRASGGGPISRLPVGMAGVIERAYRVGCAPRTVRAALIRKTVRYVKGDFPNLGWGDIEKDAAMLSALRALRAAAGVIDRRPDEVRRWLAMDDEEIRAVVEDEGLMATLGGGDDGA